MLILILLPLFLLPLIANAGQMDLLHQGVREFVPHTYGLKPPNADKNNIPTYPYTQVPFVSTGFSNLVRQIGLNGEILIARAPMKDDIIIDSTVVIDYDTTIYGNIILVGDAQFIVRDCSFFLKGNLYAYQNSLFSVKNTDFVIPQDFIYQFRLTAFDSAMITISNSRLHTSNFPISAATLYNASFVMDSVDMDGAFVTFGLLGNNSSIDIRHSDKAGEFVLLGDSAQLNIAHSDTVLIWLGFPRGSSGELHGSPTLNEWVEQFTYPDSTCTGINYSIKVDSLYELMLATMAMDSTFLTIYDANLQSAGNIFEIATYDTLGVVIPDTISGLVDDSHYDNWLAPLPKRNLHLVNSSIRAWNLYFCGETNLTLKSSIFGECLSDNSNSTTLMSTTCDGFGGHIGASGSSFLIAFLTSLYTDALMEGHSVSILLLTNFIFGHLIARNMAISIIYNTILAHPILAYDSATVMVTGLYPPSPAHINDTLSIKGSATIVKAPESPFEFEGYRVEYAPKEDTSQFFPLTNKITTPVNNGELCEFITCGLDVGNYIIRLLYFFSAFGGNDSFSFDNVVYLTYKPGVNEFNPTKTAADFTLRAFPNPFTTKTSIEFTVNNLQFTDVIQSSEATYQLMIYDLSGRLIRTFNHLTNQPFNQVIWDADGFPGGVYFCKLKVGPSADELPPEKIILLKQ